MQWLEPDGPEGHGIVTDVAITDTSAQASFVQWALYRKLDSRARAMIAVELSDAVRETAVAGIRRRNPDYTDEQVWRTLRVMLYGPARDKG